MNLNKNLVLLAGLFALQGAFAQSSVTLYGIADVGIGKTAGGKVGLMGGGLMNNAMSRFGLRGVEDLGGGNKVGFVLEAGLNLGNGASWNGGNGGGMWGRQANLWVEGNWGTFRMGRSYIPASWASWTWDLTGTATYNLVESTYGDAGSPSSRQNNQFGYQTPVFGNDRIGKFSAYLAYVLAADNHGKERFNMYADYYLDELAVAFAVDKVEGQDTGYQLGAKYNFGLVTVAGSYNDAHSLRRGFTLGARLNLDPFTFTLDTTHDIRNRKGPEKYNNVLLEGKYRLSKQVLVYAAYQRLDGGNSWGVGLQKRF